MAAILSRPQCVNIVFRLFADENFIGEAGGLFEEPPVPEVVPPAPEVPEAVAVPPGKWTELEKFVESCGLKHWPLFTMFKVLPHMHSAWEVMWCAKHRPLLVTHNSVLFRGSFYEQD